MFVTTNYPKLQSKLQSVLMLIIAVLLSLLISACDNKPKPFSDSNLDSQQSNSSNISATKPLESLHSQNTIKASNHQNISEDSLNTYINNSILSNVSINISYNSHTQSNLYQNSSRFITYNSFLGNSLSSFYVNDYNVAYIRFVNNLGVPFSNSCGSLYSSYSKSCPTFQFQYQFQPQQELNNVFFTVTCDYGKGAYPTSIDDMMPSRSMMNKSREHGRLEYIQRPCLVNIVRMK